MRTAGARRLGALHCVSRAKARGCTRGPGHPLIPHHATPWARWHTTSLSGTVLLCEQTHHDLHEGPMTIKLKDGRHLNPNGWANGPSGQPCLE